jgi:hypothetical protein
LEEVAIMKSVPNWIFYIHEFSRIFPLCLSIFLTPETYFWVYLKSADAWGPPVCGSVASRCPLIGCPRRHFLVITRVGIKRPLHRHPLSECHGCCPRVSASSPPSRLPASAATTHTFLHFPCRCLSLTEPQHRRPCRRGSAPPPSLLIRIAAPPLDPPCRPHLTSLSPCAASRGLASSSSAAIAVPPPPSPATGELVAVAARRLPDRSLMRLLAVFLSAWGCSHRSMVVPCRSRASSLPVQPPAQSPSPERMPVPRRRAWTPHDSWAACSVNPVWPWARHRCASRAARSGANGPLAKSAHVAFDPFSIFRIDSKPCKFQKLVQN